MDITLNTRLADIGRHYGETGDLERDIHDNMDVITDDLIDTRIVGDDWGEALDQVLRSEGVETATVGDLSRVLHDRAREREDIASAQISEDEHLSRIARGWLAADFVLRQIMPACLRALPVLDEHANRFAALPQVTSLAALDQAMRLVRETREALREHTQPPHDIGSVEDVIATLLSEAEDLELLDVTSSRYHRDSLDDPDEAIAADDAAERVEAILAELSLAPILRAYTGRPTTIG
jgi:hypothetical protein